MTKQEQEKFDRENCDICAQRFNCDKVKNYDKGEKVNLHNCAYFDDVYAK